jgi:hypothetical protein
MQQEQKDVQIESNCHNCGLHARAEAKPEALLARLWRWHTGWCPGWKAYLQELESKGLPAPQV